jgi:DNA-binding transcriptional regulator GbsR (MarR family)
VADRDEQAAFIERFAAILTEAGWPRMPARVFVALLITDSGRLTSAELCDMLQVSPAAVSGAVRYNAQIGLVRRERDPATRRDVYSLHDDVWPTVGKFGARIYSRFADELRPAIELLGADTPAGVRAADTVSFFEYLTKEIPAVMDRWKDQRGAGHEGARSRVRPE